MSYNNKHNDFKTFSTYPINKLFHVGDMNITKKQPFSHEGSGLSVSICPYKWLKIAKGCMASSNVFCFTHKKPMFLDFHSMTDGEVEEIGRWGIENNYATEEDKCIFIYFDDEWDANISTMYHSLEEALDDNFTDDEWASLTAEEKATYISKEKILIATKKLNDEIGWDISKESAFPYLTTIYAEKILSYHGVYWDDILDTSRLSAPRGVIFNSMIKEFEISKYSLYGSDLEDALPEPPFMMDDEW